VFLERDGIFFPQLKKFSPGTKADRTSSLSKMENDNAGRCDESCPKTSLEQDALALLLRRKDRIYADAILTNK
jgi:hypothetical protein